MIRTALGRAWRDASATLAAASATSSAACRPRCARDAISRAAIVAAAWHTDGLAMDVAKRLLDLVGQ